MKKVLLLLVLLCSFNLFSQNWVPVTTGTTGEVWGIDYVDANLVWMTVKAGNIFKSTNGGTTWTAAGMTAEGAFSIAAIDANIAVVVTGPTAGVGKIYRTINGGTTWTVVYTGPTGCWFNFVDNIDATNLWALSDPTGSPAKFHIMKSTDAGATWALCSNLPSPANADEFGAAGSFYRIGNNFWFGAGENSTTLEAPHVYKSTSVDGPWTMTTTTASAVGTISFSSPTGAGVAGFWSNTATINRTTDGGNTWTSAAMPFANNATGSDFVRTTSYAWMTTSDNVTATLKGDIWMTTDNGATWTLDLHTVKGLNVVRIFGDINNALAGGLGGNLYKSTRSAITPVELTSFTAAANNNTVTLNWSTATELNNKGFEIQKKSATSDFMTVGFVNGNGSSTEVHSYSFSETNIAGTYTYRLRQVDFNGNSEFSDAVEVVVSNPDQYSLNQNYPNPFNPSTKIDFTLAQSGMVKLAVYNLLGQQVQTLVNEVRGAGSHSVSFNASNLTSGIYFYKLETPDFSKTMKMILNK